MAMKENFISMAPDEESNAKVSPIDNNKTLMIDQYTSDVEPGNPELVEDIQTILPTFKEYLESVQNAKGYDLMIMMFSNIMAEGSMFVFSGPIKNIMKELIETQIDEMSGYDSVIISRKQQLVPKISELLKMM